VIELGSSPLRPLLERSGVQIIPGSVDLLMCRIDRPSHHTRHLSLPLDLPVLGVGGERLFGAAVAENLRHSASNVRQAVFADCGHYVSEERPAELASLLLSFFDGT
jgi:pimeloyl-ACP methyl ester carboxylesterase